LDYIVSNNLLKAFSPLALESAKWKGASFTSGWPAGYFPDTTTETIATYPTPAQAGKFLFLLNAFTQKKLSSTNIQKADFFYKDQWATYMTALKAKLVAGGFLTEEALATRADGNAGWVLATAALTTREAPTVSWSLEHNNRRFTDIQEDIAIQYRGTSKADPRTAWPMTLPDYSADTWGSAELADSAEFVGYMKPRTGRTWAKKSKTGSGNNYGSLKITRTQLVIKSGTTTPNPTIPWVKATKQGFYWKLTTKTEGWLSKTYHYGIEFYTADNSLPVWKWAGDSTLPATELAQQTAIVTALKKVALGYQCFTWDNFDRTDINSILDPLPEDA